MFFEVALGIVMVSFWRGAHRAKTSNGKPDPCGNALARKQVCLEKLN